MASEDGIVAAENVAPPSVDYQGNLPPLIDRQTFFGDPQRTGAQISPDGKHVAFIKPYKGVMNIWVKGVDEPFDAAEPVTADTAHPVNRYYWTQDSERILYVQNKGGNENHHIYAVNPDSEKETDLGVPPAEDLTPYKNVRARIIDVPEDTPGKIIVGLNDRNPKYHDVYRLNLKTGERTLLYKNDKRIAGWVTDLDGDLRLATRQTSDGGTEILRVKKDTLVSVYECSFRETCSPVRFHKDGKRVYMQTNKGDDVNLTRLVLFNLKTKETEVVASDPEGEVDFGGAIFNDRTGELAATVYVDERQRVYPKTEAFKQKYQTLKQKLPDGEISLGASTEDFQTHIVSVSRDVNPGATYLLDAESGTVEKLYESRPELPSDHLAKMKPITYEARDGLEIPAYLTTPKDVEAKNLPPGRDAARRSVVPRHLGIQSVCTILRQPRLRGPSAQLPRLHRLRPNVPQCGQQGVGRQDAERPHRWRAISCGERHCRLYARRDLRGVLWRLRDAGGPHVHPRGLHSRGLVRGTVEPHYAPELDPAVLGAPQENV
jgi:dipeptidyl aminopeptidase/acylaminoacyl peptidase